MQDSVEFRSRRYSPDERRNNIWYADLISVIQVNYLDALTRECPENHVVFGFFIQTINLQETISVPRIDSIRGIC